MHYYVQMPKQGQIHVWSNHNAYKDFLVNARWVAGYVQRGKMSIKDTQKVIVSSFGIWILFLKSSARGIAALTKQVQKSVKTGSGFYFNNSAYNSKSVRLINHLVFCC